MRKFSRRRNSERGGRQLPQFGGLNNLFLFVITLARVHALIAEEVGTLETKVGLTLNVGAVVQLDRLESGWRVRRSVYP